MIILKNKGVTLVELIIAIAIASIISIVIFSINVNGQKVYSTAESETAIQNSARRLIDNLTNSINSAQAASAIMVSNNQVNVDGNTFTNLINCKGLIYVKLNSDSANPFIYVIKNNAVYKIYKDGTGWSSPIASYISNTTSVDAPFSTNSNAYRVKLNLTYKNISKSYTTFISVGGN